MTYRSLMTLPALGLRREFDRLFDDVLSTPSVAGWSPAVDVEETKDAMIVTADLPGIAPDKLEVTADQNVLSIKGTRAADVKEKTEGQVHVRERVQGTFVRRFTLPTGYNLDAVEATFAHGVLTLRVPRVVSPKPRTIAVKTDVSSN